MKKKLTMLVVAATLATTVVGCSKAQNNDNTGNNTTAEVKKPKTDEEIVKDALKNLLPDNNVSLDTLTELKMSYLFFNYSMTIDTKTLIDKDGNIKMTIASQDSENKEDNKTEITYYKKDDISYKKYKEVDGNKVEESFSNDDLAGLSTAKLGASNASDLIDKAMNKKYSTEGNKINFEGTIKVADIYGNLSKVVPIFGNSEEKMLMEIELPIKMRVNKDSGEVEEIVFDAKNVMIAYSKEEARKGNIPEAEKAIRDNVIENGTQLTFKIIKNSGDVQSIKI